MLALLIAVGALGISSVARVAGDADTMFERAVEPLADLGVARAQFNENRAHVNDHILEVTGESVLRSTG